MSDGGREDTLALFDADEEPRFGKPEDFEDILLALWIQLGHKYYLPQTNSKVQLCFQLIPSAFVPYLDTLISLSSDPRSHKKFIRLFRYITNFEIFDTIPRADRRDGTVSANALREHSSVTEAVLKEPGVKEAVLKDAGAKETGVKETDPRKKVNYTPARESSKPEGGKSEPQSVPSTRDPGSQDECGTFSEALRSKCTSWSKRSSEAAGPSWRVSVSPACELGSPPVTSCRPPAMPRDPREPVAGLRVESRGTGFRGSGFRGSGFRESGFRESGFRESGFRESGFRESGFRGSGSRERPKAGTKSPDGTSYFHRFAPSAFHRSQLQPVAGAPSVSSEDLFEELPRGWGDRKKKAKQSDGSSTFWLYPLTPRECVGRPSPPPYWTLSTEDLKEVLESVSWSFLLYYQNRRIACASLQEILFVLNITERGPCLSLFDRSRMMDLEFQLLPEPQVQTRWRRTLQLLGAEYMSFYDLVRNVSKIGGGNFSQVYQGTYWLTGEEVIIKAVEKKRLQQANALTEILVLRSVSHPSIVSFRGAFQNQKTVILITEYLRGGDLFDFIKRNGRMSERDSRDAMEKILQALVTLHARGIVHRDLKTENVMLRNPFDGTSVCLIDFGLSATLDSELMTMRCGSPGYVAPEVLLEKGKYNSKCDVFSAGVVLYTMLTGKPPFRGEDAKCILKKNARAKIVFPDYLSEEVKSLISWMTQRRPELRCSTQDALQHPFFTHESLPHGPFISHNGEDTCLQLPKHILSQDHKFYFDRMSPNTTAVI